MNIAQDEGKTIHQVFEVTMGIEKVQVAVPYSLAESFETKLLDVRPNTERALKKLTTEFKGQILK